VSSRDPSLPEDVLEGIRRRDPAAFAACYEALADPLYAYLRYRCGDATLAEDLVLATFCEFVEAAPALVGGPSAVRAWLFRAGRNNMLDAVRKAKRRADAPLDVEQAAALPAEEAGPETRAIAREESRRLRAALDELSPDQREVLVLRFFAGLSGPEVASVTGRRVGAVKALQHRGIRALERALDAHGTLDAFAEDYRENEGARIAEPPSCAESDSGGEGLER
jgi:RNA polymerase sigma-70 factor, ECF subfamily